MAKIADIWFKPYIQMTPNIHDYTCEGVYDQDTNVKWWQCSTDELLLDDREYKYFTLCQDIFEKPSKRNIIFNKQGELVLLCNDAEWYRITKTYGTI